LEVKHTMSGFDSIDSALDAIKRGEMVIVMDDEDRENEGDLIMAAEFATAEKIGFLVRYSTGIICAPMKASRAEKLALPPMVVNNTDPKKTAFTVSCDHVGVSTGVSGADRALTFRKLAAKDSTADEFCRPGHVFPLVAKPGGVFERRGHTEASVDLCRFAGCTPVAVIGEITNDDGTMARLPECQIFARRFGMKLITIEALVAWRKENEAAFLAKKKADKLKKKEKQQQDEESKENKEKKEKKVELLAECKLPIQRGDKDLGDWTLRCYLSHLDNLRRHIVLIKGDVAELAKEEPVLVRVHSECFTGDVLGSQRCDCGEQLNLSLVEINRRGRGLLIYVDGHEGRGIGLENKLKAYHAMQANDSIDTYLANEMLGFPAEMRNYDTPLAILEELNISKIELLSNNPEKFQAFEEKIAAFSPLLCKPNKHNEKYLGAKRNRETALKAAITLPLQQQHQQQQQKEEEGNSKEKQRIEKYDIIDKLKKEVPLALPAVSEIEKLRLGIVRTRWNAEFVDSFFEGTKEALLAAKVKSEHIFESVVPGAWELPFAAQRMIQSGTVDAVICFGVLIKGQTQHFKFISQAVSQGLMKVQLKTGVPVIYGVLHCTTIEQAIERCNSSSTLIPSLAATAINMATLKGDAVPIDNTTSLSSSVEDKTNNQLNNKQGDFRIILPASFTTPLVPPCYQG